MDKTLCVIKRGSVGFVLVVIISILMVAGTIFAYRYEPANSRWWTAVMTPDKYSTVQGMIISFVFRIICALSMLMVVFANTDLNVMLVPPVAFLITSVASAAISSDYTYIFNSANIVCIAFIVYLLLFQYLRILRKNKWISFAFLLPIAYYIFGILTGRKTNEDGFIYLSSVVYFSLMYAAFTVIGFSAEAVDKAEFSTEDIF